MSIRVSVGLLVAALSLSPPAAVGQQPVEIAFADPQPHFVAAWAPKKPREAERSAVLARRLSLRLEDVSLDAALKELINQAGLNITYSPAVLPEGKRVTIGASDVAVVTALTEILFRSGLDVVVDRDGALALVVCKHPAPRAEIQDSGTIVGTVTDKATGAPIAGATVEVEGTRRSSTTGSDGGYRIDGIEDGTYTLRVRYIGYSPMESSVEVPGGGEVTADFALVKSLQKLDELVTVTPGGMQVQLRALSSAVTIIGANDIAERNPQMLADVVRQEVPTSVAFANPVNPQSTLFTVRGASSLSPSSSALKILIDGVEAARFVGASIDPKSIERFEVIRGPQAATLYGADAANGVIQVFTKRGGPHPSKPKIEAQTALGLTQTPYDGYRTVPRQQYTARLYGGGDDMSYSLGGGYTHLPDYLPNGQISRQSTPSVYGGIRSTHGILAADFSGRYQRNKLGSAFNPILLTVGLVSQSQPSYTVSDFTNETYGSTITVTPKTWWINRVTAGIDRALQEDVQERPRLTTAADTLLTLFTSTSRKVFVSYNTSISGVLTRSLAGSLTGGIDHHDRTGSTFFTSRALNAEGTIQTSPPGAFDQSRFSVRNTGYFIEGRLGFRESVFLTGGLRVEDNSTFGASIATPVLPHVGISWVQEFRSTTLKVRGSYGRAMRVPSPGQSLAAAAGGSIQLANPLLAPEQQQGWDAGIDLFFEDGASLAITGFDQTARDLILFSQLAETSAPTFQYQNIGRVTNRGVEVEARASVWQLRLKGQYGYVKSRVTHLGSVTSGTLQVGDPPESTPAHTAGASITWLPGSRTRVTAGLAYVGSYRRLDVIALFSCFGGTGPCRPTVRDYVVSYPSITRVNALVTQRLTPQLQVFLGADNLTNQETYEGSNFLPVVGRTTTVGLRIDY
ncbi:MAG: TonB-dependent receptor [Gemmatimonadales bacterium]